MDPIIGEIRLFGGTFAPVGWHFCDGTLLDISSNQALFTLIGTTYGGDGQTTFGLPDLRGRAIVHMGTLAGGSNYQLGVKAGVESVTLTTANLPVHTHALNVSNQAGTAINPTNNFIAGTADPQISTRKVCKYIPGTAPDFTLHALNPASITPVGGSQPHENRQPFLAINYIISTEGIFPSQN